MRRRRRRGAASITREQEQELKLLFADVVMMRAGASLYTEKGRRQWYGLCEWCNSPRWLCVSHIEPVGHVRQLRFDVNNARALCKRCHLYRWHRWPREAEEFAVRIMGAEARSRLAARAKLDGFTPDFETTKLYLIAQRVKITLATGHNAALKG